MRFAMDDWVNSLIGATGTSDKDSKRHPSVVFITIFINFETLPNQFFTLYNFSV